MRKCESLLEKIEKVLPLVEKPGRYIGAEYNIIKKDWDSAEVRMALGFPDAYEIGMSHLGSRILYSLVNSFPFALCERVYTPWIDMEQQMKEKELPLFTLESYRPVNAFDIFGISIQYELGSTNILTLLDLAGIPLYASQRSSEDPLVIGGGPCAVNPEPLSVFFDVFIIGDGEEVLAEVLGTVREWKKDSSQTRHDLLKKISQEIEGAYVPAFPVKKVVKRKVSDLDTSYYPDTWLVPNIGIVHDRVVVEVMRGCYRKCRFCQAASVNCPVRFRKKETVLKHAKRLLESSGYEEISLSGLSISDYPDADEVVRLLIEEGYDKKISVAVPSSRIDSFSIKLAQEVQRVKKTGITFAPEAGSERLRRVLNKVISDEQILTALNQAFQAGWLTVKLYFMVGLPTETQEDLTAIITLINKIVNEGMQHRKRVNLNVTISNFIPKPHTPFQWTRMNGIEELRQKHQFLLDAFRKNKRVHIKFHDPEMSILEAIFSRGDTQLSTVILEAWKSGVRFDGWSDTFNYSLWRESFQKCEIDLSQYLDPLDINKALPWDYIYCGEDKNL